MKLTRYQKHTLRSLYTDTAVLEALRDKHATAGERTPLEAAASRVEVFLDQVNADSVQAGRFDALEAIVLTEGRPALLIQDGTFNDPELPPLRERITPHRKVIEDAIRSVARLELLNHSSLSYAGTAWMVDTDVMITNRHVANLFAHQFGGRLVFRTNPAGERFKTQVDFFEEHDRDAVFEVPILEVLHMEDDSPFAPDFALVKVQAADELPPPIVLATNRPVPEEDIAVIGYPARDLRNPPAIMDDLFGGVYEVKRLSPGRVSGMGDDSFVFNHDCTTLGGNSGSVVLRTATGEAVGLHFSGSFLENNFAVTSAEILRRLAQLRDRLFISPRPNGDLQLTPEPSIASDVEAPSAADLVDRSGYDAQFLGPEIPLPPLSGRLVENVAPTENGESGELKYTHYSVLMHAARRMAIYTACNVSGAEWFHIPRERDRWFFDPRIDRAFQVGDDLYRNNRLQRGHLVRRLDPAWGADREEVRQAILDTYFWTNCTPQHERFNPRSWLSLERYILNNAVAHDLKVSVFTGPVFKQTDETYRGMQIPKDYWKVLAIVRADTGRLSVTAYLLSQSEFMDHLEFIYGEFRTYQVPLGKICDLTEIDFSNLSRFDPMSRLEAIPFVEIQSGADMIL